MIISINKELKLLHSLATPSTKAKKRIAYLSNKISEINDNKLQFLAKKFNIDFKVYGNSATKFFISCEKFHKQKLIVKAMSINSIESSNPIEIGSHRLEIYNIIFNQSNP